MILGAPQYHVTPSAFAAAKDELVAMGIAGKEVGEAEKASVILVHANDNTDLRDDQIDKRKGKSFVAGTDIEVLAKADKMSKSRGNVVNPDDIVREYGADSLRLYEMFMGPLEATKPWAMEGVGGVRNFLDRVWRLVVDHRSDEGELSSALSDGDCDEEQNRVLHQTIKKVTEDTDAMSFNTAIARMMEFTNHFSKSEQRPKSAIKTFLILLSPYAPHIAEELWWKLGEPDTIAHAAWPQYDEAALVQSSIEVPVQINGKIKTKIQVPPQISKEELAEVALSDDRVKQLIEGKTIVKQIVVPGRLVNLVVK
jgi:leucyl-tRNA synthetase